jgi:hypothetical protein
MGVDCRVINNNLFAGSIPNQLTTLNALQDLCADEI